MTEQESLKQLQAEVKLLISQGKIKQFSGVDDLSEETLKNIIQDYNDIKLEGVNNTIFKGLVNGIILISKHTTDIPTDVLNNISDNILENDDVVGCSSSIISYITPRIPLVGMLTGGVILAKFLYDGLTSAKEQTKEGHTEE